MLLNFSYKPEVLVTFSTFDTFHSEFLDPLSSFSVEYKSQSNDVNDSKKEDLGQLFCILLIISRQPELTNCIIPDPISFDLSWPYCPPRAPTLSSLGLNVRCKKTYRACLHDRV